MDAILVHSQPQVLGQCTCVPLDHFKDGRPIQWPLAHKSNVRLVALLFRKVRVFPVLAGDVLRTYTLLHVLGNIALNYGTV